MCGIAGVYLKNPSIVSNYNDEFQFDRFFDKLLLSIESRGRDSTGFVAARNTFIQLDKKPIKASDFIKTRRRAWMTDGTRMVLGHTRFATQGAPEYDVNNHPVRYGTTFITHNGHIHNDDDVFDELDLPRYDVAVDSVAIAATLEKHGFNDLEAALKLLKGSYAVAAINPTKAPDELLLIKGPVTPINYYETKHMLVWASTSQAIRDAWEEVLGEPPPIGQVKWLSEGDVIHVKDGEVELKPKFFKPTPQYTGTYLTAWSNHGAKDYRKPNTTAVGSKPKGLRTILNLIDPIAERRAQGHGIAVTFANRASMTPDQLKAHTNKFMTCLHCDEMIAEFHILDNAVWGEICVDCLTYAISATSRLPEAASGKNPAEYASMSQDDYDFLLEYAEFEYEVMQEAVDLVSQRTGVQKEMIFFLVFASEYNNLDAAADEFRAKLYDEYLSAEKYLIKGGSFLEDQTDEEVEEIEACEIPIPPARQIEAPAGQTMGKCDHCRKKAKVLQSGHRWCNLHATKCTQRSCKSDVVAWDGEGKRWCHTHSRGRKKLTYLPRATVTA